MAAAPFMNCIRRLLLILTLAATLLPAHAAEDKKDEKKKDPPKIVGAFPFAIVPGATNKIKIRGLSLTNATLVLFPTADKLTAEIKSRGKASVPEKADPKKLGDTQLEVVLVLPSDFPAGDLPFFVTAPEGDTTTNQLRVIERALLFDEKEPNAGFRKPNEVKLPQTIRGTIEAANDVDVFRFIGRAEQKVRIESLSMRYGSSLDPIVTLHDARGHTLVSSDDAGGGADALGRLTLPSDGPYFVSIIDAHDRGGASYGYVLAVEVE
jgi:hypothetical protein